MDSAVSCPANDLDPAQILCSAKETAHTADLYSVRVPDRPRNGHVTFRSVDQWKASGQCTRIRISTSASWRASGIGAIVQYCPVSP
jgi:hypothetical protein